MKKTKLYVALALVLTQTISWGQDTIVISKKEINNKVADKNLQIKIADQAFKAAQADYRQSNALFLPSITASHTGFSTTNPLMAFGSKLNQEILTAADFDPALLNNPARTQNFATKIEILQPLINVDGFYGRQAAKAKMEAFQLQSERTKEYLELEINKAYMQLQLAYKAVSVMNKANTTASSNLEIVNNYFKQGMLQKTDVLTVEIRVNEVKNQLQYAKSNVQNASDYLAFLINEDLSNSVFKPIEELENSISAIATNPLLSGNRKDLLAMDQTVKAYEKMAQSSQMNFVPRLNAFGSYELYDKNFLGMGANGYLVGAQLSWNVFDGYKSIGKMEKAKAEHQKSSIENQQYKAQSQIELNKTNRQLKDSENKVGLAKLALQQAEEAYRIRKNRFQQGLEKTSDLLQAATQMSQKELELLQAVFEYNTTKDYLHFLSQ